MLRNKTGAHRLSEQSRVLRGVRLAHQQPVLAHVVHDHVLELDVPHVALFVQDPHLLQRALGRHDSSLVAQSFLLVRIREGVLLAPGDLFRLLLLPLLGDVVVVEVRVQTCVDDAFGLALNAVHLGDDALGEDIIELLGVLDDVRSLGLFLRLLCLRLMLVRVAKLALRCWVLHWLHADRRPVAHPLPQGCFLELQPLHDLVFDIEAPLQAPLAQKVLLGIYILLFDLHVVFLFVEVRVSRVIVLVLEVLEAFLLIQGGEQLAVSVLHLHQVKWERRQLGQRLHVRALLHRRVRGSGHIGAAFVLLIGNEIVDAAVALARVLLCLCPIALIARSFTPLRLVVGWQTE